MLSILSRKCQNARLEATTMILLRSPRPAGERDPRRPGGKWRIPALLLAALGACGQNFSVSVNDRAVFDPAGRLPAGEVADADLQGCINFALIQQNAPSAADLPVLACPDSEIRSLAAIEVLEQVRFLDLGNNNIGNVTPLERLPLLSALNLSGNAVTDAGPLLNIESLVSLDLRGNDGIPCSQVDALRERLGENLLAPDDCE